MMRRIPRSSFMVGPLGLVESSAIDEMILIAPSTTPSIAAPAMVPPQSPATSPPIPPIFLLSGLALVAYWLLKRS